MRFSQFFIPTIKETPKDAVLKSHQYLVRGGYIHQIGSGIYNFLPLGKRVLDKISQIVKEEMDSAGCIEIAMGFVTPAELWKQSGRYEKYGKELLRFLDRKNNDFVLGPTYEEAITDIARNFIKSYKNLPVSFYQINLKFRDEVRPRFGLMRGREFIMKDAYSFHSSYEDLDREFENMHQAYKRIFTRLELDFRVVDADSGAIGGSGSKEFMVLADCGEDTIVVCKNCEYASNIEAAKRQKRVVDFDAPKAEFAKFSTPNVKSVEELSAFFRISSFYILKVVVKKVIFLPEKNMKPKLAFFFVRGDDELEEIKALNVLSTKNSNVLELVDASSEDIKSAGLCEGFIGPYSLRNITQSEFIFFDEDLREERDLICGANEENYHFVGVDLSTFEGLEYVDLAKVREGDICTCCGGVMEYKKGIEVGHIFKLGTKYSEAMQAMYLDQNGKMQPFVMGCYGIGISRLLSAILEQKSDEKGCVWTKASAPFAVSVIISNSKNEIEREFGEELYKALKQKNIEVLLDDRLERFGFKIKDFELIGNYKGVVIGKELENNKVEIIHRDGMQKTYLNAEIQEIVQFLENHK
ncbi:proline--tRNA ligase [Helicobacter sp. faydin-H20]|uniref:proline--tRNA ligase n=1 Tax=Helicobacter anatolicus TaxID=2905874 RepID=UPI001E3AE839|nr:proline--tRNA ligase [Helicobacter anatolicus]MCE3037290.1 proline--tRNA ligase [Helicobacter anatolicus]